VDLVVEDLLDDLGLAFGEFAWSATSHSGRGQSGFECLHVAGVLVGEHLGESGVDGLKLFDGGEAVGIAFPTAAVGEHFQPAHPDHEEFVKV
jgi:hypothetical protein